MPGFFYARLSAGLAVFSQQRPATDLTRGAIWQKMTHKAR